MQRRDFLSALLYGSGTIRVPCAWNEMCKTHNSQSAQPRSLRIGALFVGSIETFGAKLGIEESQHASVMLGSSVSLVTTVVSDAPDSTTTAISRMAESEGLSAIIGGGNTTACQEISLACTRAGLIFLNTVEPSDVLRAGGCASNTFHVVPSARMGADTLASAAASAAASADKRLRAVAWHSSLRRYGADTLNIRYRTRFQQAMSERAWTDWLAVKILWETFLRVRSADPAVLAAALTQSGAHFDGHKGRPLSFRAWDHQLRQPMYLVADNATENANVIEVPAPTSEDETSIQALDRIGIGASATTCHFTS